MMKKKKIYTILTFESLGQDPITKAPELGSERLVGWYSDFATAEESVRDNACDINETCYRYALIEECSEGLYQYAPHHWLYEYNKETDTYNPIEEPPFMKVCTTFTIG